MVHTCRIPGCSTYVAGARKWQKDFVPFKQFKLKDPKFCRTEKDRIWAERLKRIMLSYCDPKKSLILRLYHVERVTICERHFTPEDIISKTGKHGQVIKKLIHGAIPTLNLPKKGGQLLPDPYAKHPERAKKQRKPPKEREFIPAIKTFASLCIAAKRMAANEKSHWKVSLIDEVVKAIKPDPDGYDQNQYTITIKDGFKIEISYYSWCLPENHCLLSYDLRVDSLPTFLKHVETLKACKGAVLPIGLGDTNLIKHVITKSGGTGSSEPLISKSLALRPKQCAIVVKEEEEHCSACIKKNKALLAQIAKKQAKELTLAHSIKRLSDFQYSTFWDLEAKRLKLSEKTTKTPGHRSSEPELSSVHSILSLDTVPKELWITPALKQAEVLPEIQKPLFLNFWKSQMEKLYAPGNNARHYSKDLMEFWSDVWQNGKQAYKRLSRSGLIGMPCSTTMKCYFKKKMKNLDNSISGVVASMSEVEKTGEDMDTSEQDESVSHVTNGSINEPTVLHNEQDNITLSKDGACGDVVVNAMRRAEVSEVTPRGENMQDLSDQTDSGKLDLLIFDHETGTTKTITLPISVLQDSEVCLQTTSHLAESVTSEQSPIMTTSSVKSNSGTSATATMRPSMKQASITSASVAESPNKFVMRSNAHQKLGGKTVTKCAPTSNKQQLKFALPTGPRLFTPKSGMVFRLIPATQDLNKSSASQVKPLTSSKQASSGTSGNSNAQIGASSPDKDGVNNSVGSANVLELDPLDTAMELSVEFDGSVS